MTSSRWTVWEEPVKGEPSTNLDSLNYHAQRDTTYFQCTQIFEHILGKTFLEGYHQEI